MALPFPIADGTLITADLLNQLVASIEDGTIFTSVSFVSDLITTLNTRVSTLEGQVAVLQQEIALAQIREQLTPTPGQTLVGLSHVPVLDSEMVFLNGVSLAKSNIPLGFVGDYTVSGSTITFNSSVALFFVSTDFIEVVYQYQI